MMLNSSILFIVVEEQMFRRRSAVLFSLFIFGENIKPEMNFNEYKNI